MENKDRCPNNAISQIQWGDKILTVCPTHLNGMIILGEATGNYVHPFPLNPLMGEIECSMPNDLDDYNKEENDGK